jgi:NADPH-dependent 2,4-dienoyl-CoA reductase/sulfur reductase-like enzyme
LIARTPQEFKEKHKINVELGHQAVEIDRKRCRLRLIRKKDSKEIEIPYDRLIIATGARSRKLGIPNENATNVFSLKDLDDGLRIRGFIDEKKPGRAIIIGAGYIALEFAEAMRERGIDTTILYRGKIPYSGIEPEVGHLIVEELKSQGVHFVPKVKPIKFLLDGQIASGLKTDGGLFEGELFFVAVGIEPNVELAKRAGIIIGETGGIRVDDRMQTSDPLIFSAGDCCEKFHRVTGHYVLAPLGDIANKEGRVAGENAAGGNAKFKGIVGASCVKIFGLEIGMAGITASMAEKLGYSVITQVIETTSRVGIYPGAERSLLKIVADASTGKLLGGNLVGRDGEARKINTIAVALWQGMTLEDVSQLDLAYAPPFSSVLDPLIVAANLLKRKSAKG